MGGSGGSSEAPSRAELDALREQVRADLDRQERDVAVNDVLAEALATFNSRKTEETRQRLDTIENALGSAVDVDRLLFGGSVAKHTYVDGLSDVDALVVVDDQDVPPDRLVEKFAERLRQALPAGDAREISPGHLAVTVRYHDGTEVQLLPAVERNGHTSIASEDGREWRQIRPHKFAEKLSEVNRDNGGGVVPTIKLAKAVLRNLPEGSKLSGYHVEAIAVDAFREYDKRRDRASMLTHLLRHAQEAVLRPTGDITGQSVHVDSHLGDAGSAQRRALSTAIASLASAVQTGPADEVRRLLND